MSDYCDECGTEVHLDEPLRMCYYTGRRCTGCDKQCNKEVAVCDDCEREIAEYQASRLVTTADGAVITSSRTVNL